MWFEILFSSILLYNIIRWVRLSLLVPDPAGKCIFVTGCDSGFGNALAKRLDSIGCRVFAGCFTKLGAYKLDSGTSKQLSTILMDVTSTENIQRAYQIVKDNLPDSGMYLHMACMMG